MSFKEFIQMAFNACANSVNPPKNHCRNVAPRFNIQAGGPFQYIGASPSKFKVDYLMYGPRQYDVTYRLDRDGRPQWVCTCDDFRFRHQITRTCCKHIQACIDMKAMAEQPDSLYKRFLTAHVHMV